MCLFVVPYSNALTMTFPENLFAKIWFSINVFMIGLLSFISWSYGTHKYKLVSSNLDDRIINTIRLSTLVEPMLSLISIVVALFDQSLWIFVWFLLPIPYILIQRTFEKSAVE